MRATLECRREDGDNQLYWNGRKMLVARGARETIQALEPPCTVDAEIDDVGGAPTVVRVHSVTRPRRAAGPGATAPDPEAAIRDFHRLLSRADDPTEGITLPSIAEAIAVQRDPAAQRAMAERYARWLAADPTRRLGYRPRQIWGPVDPALWPKQELLDALAQGEVEDLPLWIVRAKEVAPGDPRIAAAEKRFDVMRAQRERERLSHVDENEVATMGELLTAVEQAFDTTLPARLRRVWESWEYRGVENLRREIAVVYRKLGKTELVVPGARGTKLSEMVRIAREIQATHFADETRDPAFLPFARDPDGAWIGLWLVAALRAHDFPVLRVGAEGPAVLAQTSEEWLA